jgi:DNA-directed RNA polymerase subunit RPC12/RpoP
MQMHYACPRCTRAMWNLATPIEGAYIAVCPVCNHSFWFSVTAATNLAFRTFVHWSPSWCPTSC